MAGEPPRPPRARIDPVEQVHHGIRLVDDYAWLRADNWREVMRDPAVLAPDIRAHLEAENAYCEAALAETGALQDCLFEELKGRVKQDDSSAPAPDGAYAYATRYRTGDQHPLLVRTARSGGEESLLLDANRLAEGKTYFRLGGTRHSPDHRRLAYATDETGGEFFAIRVRDLETGEDLSDKVEGSTGGMAWAADGRSFFYVWLDENHRPCKVFRHVLGTRNEADILVYAEPDPGFFVGLGETQSGRFAVIDCHDHETSEVRLIERATPDAAPLLVAARETGVEYDVDHRGDDLVILTNADAEDFRIVTAPLASPGRDAWQNLVPHEPGRLILDIVAFAGHLVRLERKDGLPRIIVRDWSDGAEHAIAFDEQAYSLGISPGYEFDTAVLRFTYSSMTRPARVYDYDMATRQRILRKEQEIPSGHDPVAYVTKRLLAPAPDGELVPVSLMHRRDLVLDGSAPCLLYGYGSYGITIPAAFNANILSLVDRGFVHAIAHVRGGKDKGYRWYAHGRREHKANTFTDFIAAAEHLAAEGYTAPGRLIAQGGSAGGLLVGAVANMRPDLFLGMIAEVPFVDILNTMLDETLPLTPPEWPEWGNPIRDKTAFEKIAAYAPYDNVASEPYPHMLVIAGLSDPRVTYWEPAKWVARLRAHKTDDNLLLLKTNMGAGHGGAPGRFDRLKEVALNYAFALTIAEQTAELPQEAAGITL